jgi:site-specific DNA recombinase
MFAERRAGRSVAGIARELNERGVPCPSAADPGGIGTQRAGVEPAVGDGDPGEPALYGASGVESPAQPARRGAISRTLSQPALGSEADFVAVQQRRAARKCKGGATRSYVLAGLVQCRWCGRRMDSHWANGRAGYRCRPVTTVLGLDP